MSTNQNIKKYWEYLEQKYDPPTFVKKVKIINFNDLKKAADSKNEKYLKKLISRMYLDNEAYIIRNAAPNKFKDTVLNLANHYKETKKSSFHKMLDGSPNFHRVIDKKITKKYSVFAIKHSFFFYNWNIKSKLEKKFKDGVYRHWRYIKFLSGNLKNQFEKNIPSDKQIDRLQIVRYPSGGGELRDHVDPRKNQRVVSGLIMSKIGEDFTKGGFFFRDKNNKKLNIENKLKLGDAVIFYGSITHGGDKVDPQKKLSWKTNQGRWFIGMFVNESNHIKDRITAKDLSGSVYSTNMN